MNSQFILDPSDPFISIFMIFRTHHDHIQEVFHLSLNSGISSHFYFRVINNIGVFARTNTDNIQSELALGASGFNDWKYIEISD